MPTQPTKYSVLFGGVADIVTVLPIGWQFGAVCDVVTGHISRVTTFCVGVLRMPVTVMLYSSSLPVVGAGIVIEMMVDVDVLVLAVVDVAVDGTVVDTLVGLVVDVLVVVESEVVVGIDVDVVVDPGFEGM